MKSKLNFLKNINFNLEILHKGKPKFVLIFLTFLCLFSMGFHYLRQDDAISLTEAAGYVVVPLQKGIDGIGSFFYSITEERLKLDEANDRISELEAQNEALMEENKQAKATQYELIRLQNLLDLKDTYSNYETVGASIIGTNSSNWYSSFTIDKGSKDGLAIDMNVIAKGGLVGIITEVSANHATVTTIIDDFSNVRGMLQSTNDACFVSGDMSLIQDGRIHLIHMDKSFDITRDNVIVTSNVSDKYLPGIVIGYAEDITLNDDKLTKSGYLVPAVDFAHLKEVLVITTLK